MAEAADPETADFAKVSPHSMMFDRSDVSAQLPPAVSALDLALYAHWLELDEPRAERLRDAHARYLKQFEEFKAAHWPTLGLAGQALYAGDTVQGWTKENLQRSREANAAALAAQRALEDAFFTEIESIVGRSSDDARVR